MALSIWALSTSGGFVLNLFSVDESYVDNNGTEKKYFPATSAMVTALAAAI